MPGLFHRLTTLGEPLLGPERRRHGTDRRQHPGRVLGLLAVALVSTAAAAASAVDATAGAFEVRAHEQAAGTWKQVSGELVGVSGVDPLTVVVDVGDSGGDRLVSVEVPTVPAEGVTDTVTVRLEPGGDGAILEGVRRPGWVALLLRGVGLWCLALAAAMSGLLVWLSRRRLAAAWTPKAVWQALPVYRRLVAALVVAGTAAWAAGTAVAYSFGALGRRLLSVTGGAVTVAGLAIIAIMLFITGAGVMWWSERRPNSRWHRLRALFEDMAGASDEQGPV